MAILSVTNMPRTESAGIGPLGQAPSVRSRAEMDGEGGARARILRRRSLPSSRGGAEEDGVGEESMSIVIAVVVLVPLYE